MDIRQSLLQHLDLKLFNSPGTKQDSPEILELNQAFELAFSAPVDYPSLDRSIFPGDRLAVVLQAGLPAAREVLHEILLHLEKIDFSLEDLVVVINPQSAKEFGFSKEEVQEAMQSQAESLTPNRLKSIADRPIAFHIHNPDNQTELAYLAANEEGDPVYLSRRLVDADVILPVGISVAGNEKRAMDCLYPDFSSTATRQRFQAGEMSIEQQRAEIRLANDAVGSFSTIQLVSGPGRIMQRVLFGLRDEVWSEAQQLSDRLWEIEKPEQARAIVATIETTTGQTDWDDIVQALLTAHQFADPAAPLIVWSEIERLPHKSLRNALMTTFEDSPKHKLTPAMRQLCDVLREHPVYLHAGLSRDEVEGLGLGYLEDARQIKRICDSLDHCLLLRDAHRCRMKAPLNR
jgi:hypothetical protein